MRERDVIERLQARLAKPSERVLVGIGDDAAVLIPPREKLLVTMDMLVEGVHFDLSYMEPGELGHKALAVNLSDIAAMGGTPCFALVSLGLKAGVEPQFIDHLYDGMRALAERYGVDIVGGNLARSPERVLVDIALIGEVDKPFTRAGARPGDRVAVTGPLGASAAGLYWLKKRGHQAREERPEITRAHLLPEPRLQKAAALSARGGVTAAIDISDGLASELHHLARQSHVGFAIDRAKIPITSATREAAAAAGVDPVEWALFGGEDYELLLTLSPNQSPEELGLHGIGDVTAPAAGVRLCVSPGQFEPLPDRGWDHLL